MIPPVTRRLAAHALRRGVATTRKMQVRWSGESASEQWSRWKEQVRQSSQEALAANEWVKQHGSPYVVLGLQEDAPLDEVKTAYRRLCLTKHPDKGGTLEEFQKIQFAHNIITKGIYQKEDRMGFETLSRNRLYALLAVLSGAALFSFYLLVFLPLRWLGRTVGLLSPPAPPTPPAETTLRQDVRQLQESVNKLQDTLDDIKEQVRRRPRIKA